MNLTPNTTKFLKKSLALRLISLLVFGGLGFGHVATAQVLSVPNDPGLANQKYLQIVNNPLVSAINQTEKTTVVAIIDEGVGWTHPDLKNQMWMNMSETSNNADDDHNGYVDDVYGFNFLDNNSDVTPKGTHGTNLAGIIAAEINNNTGIAGLAQNVKIMPLTACDQSRCDQAAIIKAIYYAVDNGAKVINLSLGDTAGYKTVYDQAITYAYNHNVVVVASAGSADYGIDLDKNPMSPVCNDNAQNMILGVGTVDNSGNRPYWANFGSCVDVSAPGTNIYTTFASGFNNNQLYGYVEGNSFSTAIVSGLAANIVSQNPNLSAAEVIARIKNNSSGSNSIINISKTLSPAPQVLGASIKFNQKNSAKKLNLTAR